MQKTKVEKNLISGLEEVLAHERGQTRLKGRVRELAPPAPRWRAHEIRNVRLKVCHMSQPDFAALLNVSTPTVRAWEQNQKHPSGAAARLLEIVEKDPGILEKLKAS
jgi:putative transcriptional regulator